MKERTCPTGHRNAVYQHAATKHVLIAERLFCPDCGCECDLFGGSWKPVLVEEKHR